MTDPRAVNHYDTLEVSARASPEVLRAAYRSLIQRFHPDRRPDDPDAAARAAAITEAYDVLSDPARRAAYDDWLAAQSAGATPVAAPAAADATADAHGGAKMPRSRNAAPRGTGRAARPAPSVGGGRWILGGLLLLLVAILVGWLWPHRVQEDDWASLRQNFSAAGHTEEELRDLLRRKEALLQRSPALREREARESIRDREARTLELLDAPIELYLGTGIMTIPRVQLVLGSFDAVSLRSYILKNRESLVVDLNKALNGAKLELLLGPDAERQLQALILDALVSALGTQPQETYPSTWFESPGRYGVVAVQLPGRYTYRPYGG
ncbi:J domain-containing protein [Roseateles sp. DB2]|uniref:J domain-containing protein n=1 Tax=Roseateles sp. DB2 TaxID=3453717 RepID=UPI003EEEB688